MHWSGALLLAYVGLMVAGALVFVVNSWQEKEGRATRLGLLVLGGAVLVTAGLVALWRGGALREGHGLVYAADAVITALALIMVLPSGRNPQAAQGAGAYVAGPVERVDERDIIFARLRSLRPGEREYDEYYRLRPERKETDDRRRALGGPLGVPGRIDRHNRVNNAALHSLYTFPLLVGRPEVVKPAPKGEPPELDAAELTAVVKGYARYVGADLVGVTRLDPRWVYSRRGEVHYGNWEDWGQPIENEHDFAIVLATEMDRDMIMARPHTPATIESSQNYSKGAIITTQLASFVSQLGYSATAHHFRHYEVLCVPLAVDAGLGELGRNGYLITREFGPRVRLAAVTTNARLVPDRPVDLGVQDFCAHCKKCAVECPSNSIPTGDKTVVNGISRWKLDADSCSTWWAKLGTDCCICMAVCPWSHPNTLTHRIGRHLAARSAAARRALIWADDFFYGRYRDPWYGQDWADYRRGRKRQSREEPAEV